MPSGTESHPVYAYTIMRLGFATDIHLDCFFDRGDYRLVQRVGAFVAQNLDALVVAGDIATGPKLHGNLSAFCKGAEIPVYFVLGNHDFWDAPEDQVRADAARIEGATFLDAAGVVELTKSVAVVGRTGWYDTLSGNPFSSRVVMDDFDRCVRLKPCWRDRHLLSQTCRKWSEEEAAQAIPHLEAAAQAYPTVYFVTHFPCFANAVWKENGELDDEDSGWLPWSVDTTLGHAILGVTCAHPHVQFTILTGHTHGKGTTHLTDNVTLVSGRARYGNPQVSETWNLSG